MTRAGGSCPKTVRIQVLVYLHCADRPGILVMLKLFPEGHGEGRPCDSPTKVHVS